MLKKKTLRIRPDGAGFEELKPTIPWWSFGFIPKLAAEILDPKGPREATATGYTGPYMIYKEFHDSSSSSAC